MTHKVDDDEDDKIVKDGQRLVVSMSLMDGMQRVVATHPIVSGEPLHRPGAVSISDTDRAQRAAVYNGYNKTLADRWKNPPPVLPGVTDAKPAPTAARDHAAMYDRYDAKVSERWRAA